MEARDFYLSLFLWCNNHHLGSYSPNHGLPIEGGVVIGVVYYDFELAMRLIGYYLIDKSNIKGEGGE